jgi:hypothetical protein
MHVTIPRRFRSSLRLILICLVNDTDDLCATWRVADETALFGEKPLRQVIVIV